MQGVVIPAEAGIQSFVVFKENGFPITPSGMTRKESLCKGILDALHPQPACGLVSCLLVWLFWLNNDCY
jgi:hypothetical protein